MTSGPCAIEVRPATVPDTAEIAALIERAVRTSNAADYDRATIERICANFTAAKVLEKMAERDVFVAHAAGAIVGTVSLGRGKLRSVFVDPPWQGRGLGRRLVAHLERHAAAVGLGELHLSSSITARSFYARLGYVEQGFEPRPDGSTFAMRKVLR